MKNNNTNNNMIMNEDMIKAIIAQAMKQGMQAGIAQAMQAQAMGAGDAGKAQDITLPQGKGKQAQGKQGKGKQAQGKGEQAQAQGIEWIACKRKEEKELIGNLRDALVQGNEGDALSYIKSWHVMVNKNKNVSDDTIIALYRNLCKVVFDGKYATVKGTKQAQVVCKSCGRIKAWLYTWNRGGVEIVG